MARGFGSCHKHFINAGEERAWLKFGIHGLALFRE